MLDYNDKIYTFTVCGSAVHVHPFDTPMQLAYQICRQHKISIGQLRKISGRISAILKAADIRHFERFFTDQIIQIKENYSLKDLGVDQSLVISTKLYEHILSPTTPVTESQTTKNTPTVSALQKQLNPLRPNTYKSQERLNRTVTVHQKSPSMNRQFLDSTEKKSSLALCKLISSKRSTQKFQTRSQSNQKLRCKTEAGTDLRQECAKIFSLMDSDLDGFISPQRIELTKISDETLKYKFNFLIQILLEIDHNKLTLDFEGFYQLFIQHFDKLDANSRQRFHALISA